MKYTLIFLMLISFNTIAGSTGVVDLEDARFQLNSNGTARLVVYDKPINDGCEQSFPVLLFDGPNANPLAEEIYSTLLMAKAAGNKVIIQTTGCWSEWSTPVITSMYLQD